MSADELKTKLQQIPPTELRYFDDVVTKFDEADFFLECMQEVGRDQRAFQHYFSAFLGAGRAVTLALQAVGKPYPDFAAWYAPHQKALMNNPLAQYMKEVRDNGLHPGARPVRLGFLDGTGQLLHFFVRTRGIDKSVPSEDVVSCCKNYLVLMFPVVDDFACKLEALIVAAESDLTYIHSAMNEVSENLIASGYPAQMFNDVTNIPELAAHYRKPPSEALNKFRAKYSS